jgi:hypothetical protein
MKRPAYGFLSYIIGLCLGVVLMGIHDLGIRLVIGLIGGVLAGIFLGWQGLEPD